ncbi:MAG: anti-sigma factor ChrR (cupin superfamily) [Flavobacteriales bacterium]|jgi:anti-sigma factor ChrR (cupin superfamily)
MLNMNFNKRIVIKSGDTKWTESPATGVWRKALAREDKERGHATSIVRYDPDCAFPAHKHPGGEEIFVLAGIFSDENGDYPAGSYLRNPPGTQHAPFSLQGCTLLVKLHQFAQGDNTQLCIDTNTNAWQQGIGGLQVMPLHSFGSEHAALVKWPANERFQAHRHFGGEEVLVLSGEFCDEHGRYPTGTWIRSPHLSQHHPFTDEETVIFVKTGHIPTAQL